MSAMSTKERSSSSIRRKKEKLSVPIKLILDLLNDPTPRKKIYLSEQNRISLFYSVGPFKVISKTFENSSERTNALFIKIKSYGSKTVKQINNYLKKSKIIPKNLSEILFLDEKGDLLDIHASFDELSLVKTPWNQINVFGEFDSSLFFKAYEIKHATTTKKRPRIGTVPKHIKEFVKGISPIPAVRIRGEIIKPMRLKKDDLPYLSEALIEEILTDKKIDPVIPIE